ncbi:MAG TPA: ATP-binding cassette domain-containing protein [Acidimicrobiales bacterium]
MGVIEVSDAGYRLPGGRRLFAGVSFRVGDGQKVAMVGANGVGKTTLLRLIAATATGEPKDAHDGTIRVDGRAAGAGVPNHLHGHVLPRWDADSNFMTTVAEARVLPEPLSVTWAKLRDAWER